MVERELERIAHVVADHGNRTTERADEPDLDCLLLGRSRARCEQQSCARGQKRFTHVFLPEAISARVLDGLMYRSRRVLVHPEKVRLGVTTASHAMRLVPVDREADGLAV